MPTDNIILTPINQIILSKELLAVTFTMRASPPKDAWVALQTLYTILPPECQKEAEQLFNEIEQTRAQIKNQQTDDIIFIEFDRGVHENEYLSVQNHLFLNHVKNSLYAHGYMKSDYSIKPRNEGIPMMRLPT